MRVGGGSHYRAFTDDSLTMMYEAVRGALAADDALKQQISRPRSSCARHLIGKSTQPTLKPRCSSAECFSKSSIGPRSRGKTLSLWRPRSPPFDCVPRREATIRSSVIFEGWCRRTLALLCRIRFNKEGCYSPCEVDC
jgi:hypothetical protein